MQTIEQLFPEAIPSGSDQSCGGQSLPANHRRYRYFAAKYRVERAVGFGLLVPAMPLIALCWCIVKITSRGPGIYRQTRVGHEGKTFQVLKLRTMRVDAEANGPQWSSKGDSRITRLGRILRKLHLDELPQLVNVVKGEMVLAARKLELEFFETMSVYTRVTRAEALASGKGKIIQGRWIDVSKGSSEIPDYRSQYVGRSLTKDKPPRRIFTPPRHPLKLLSSL